MGLLASLGIKTAKEIRDWYVSRGFPESVADRIASGELDPSFEAAIQRSIDQGFLNEDMFHAPSMDGFIGNEISIGASQNGDFGVPQQAFFLSSSPKNSETYLGQTWLAANNPALKDYSGGIVQNDVAKVYAHGANIMPMRIKPGKYDQYFGGVYGPEIHDEIADAASRGIDSVIYDDFIDPGFFQLGQAKPQRTAAIINPNNIRSKFAMFDPEYTGPNILGTTAATAGALGLLASPEEAEARGINVNSSAMLPALAASSLFEPSQERALQAANEGLLSDAMTVDEQADMAHRRRVNERMSALGLLQDPMYEYGTILPQKTNIATGETSLAFPEFVQGIARGLLDIGSTRDTKRYNPAALLEVL